MQYIFNLQSSFTYDNFGRRTLRTLQLNNTTIASAGRSYDTFGRIASISNGTDTLSYTYRPGGQLSLSGWRNAQNDAMSNQSYEYDQYNRLTGIKLNNINEVSYTLNAKDQRTAATYANAGLWNFTYDDKGQVTGANGSSKSYTYSYDGIGNRLTANENSTVTNYTSNLLNQYTLINNTAPEYDADGNMTTSGNGWAYTYNGENRITQATKGSTSVTMAYDYAGRRISKTVSESGVVQNSYKYIYDGFKLIAIYNNNDLVMTFTWQPESLGMDVPVSMTYGGATYYYVTDGNKNVTALLDASGNRVAEYVYGPFGQTVSATGSMAQINPFRFSSEFHDDETGLVYYNYRYYSPELGRWTKRDPIEEDGGFNLYSMSYNNFINGVDKLGLDYVTLEDNGHVYYTKENFFIFDATPQYVGKLYVTENKDLVLVTPSNDVLSFDVLVATSDTLMGITNGIQDYIKENRLFKNGAAQIGAGHTFRDRAILIDDYTQSGYQNQINHQMTKVDIQRFIEYEIVELASAMATSKLAGTILIKTVQGTCIKAAPIARAIKIHKHHPFPKVLGGKASQKLYDIPATLHRKYHSQLNKSMRDAGLWPLFGKNGSQVKWGLYLEDPQKAQKAYSILRETTLQFDKENGTKIYGYLIEELKAQGKYFK